MPFRVLNRARSTGSRRHRRLRRPAPISSKRAASADQLENKHDNGHHQQNVNQTAADRHDECPKQPENQKDDDERVKHQLIFQKLNLNPERQHDAPVPNNVPRFFRPRAVAAPKV